MNSSVGRAIGIMYHDVVPPGDLESSGFAGTAAGLYKLDEDEFDRQLDGIKATPRLTTDPWPSSTPIFLTFDDGGVSAHSTIAPALEHRGWRGHFFVTTDRVGTAGFLDAGQIRDLAARGHVIGSHSCSHPPRISACTPAQLRHEWRDSCDMLAELLGFDVTVASVPGGFYSAKVGEAAAEAGVRVLFTSEPTTRLQQLGDCTLVGRYGVWRGMPMSTSGRIAAGESLPRWRQWIWWSAKKAAKALPGDPYAKARRLLLRARG